MIKHKDIKGKYYNKCQISLYPNKPDIFFLIAIVKYNKVIYKNNVIIILWVSLIIVKNLQMGRILHYLF
jgi:hypothetical protein